MENNNYDVLSNYIYKLARSFTNDYSLIEDLYQQGMIGVLKAEKKYDKSSNVSFIYYAKMYIYGEMYEYFNSANKTFKTSKDVLKIYKKIKETKDMLTQELKRLPSIYELSKYLNISENKI